MLEVARDVSSEAIEYVQGDALSLPFEDGTFDVVTCQQAVQFFPDRPQALREFRRVLGAGGRAVIACWAEIDASPGYRAIADAMAEDLPDLVGAARNPFALHDPEVLRELMESAGFSDIGVQRVGRPGAFASASEFARSYVAGSALATSLADHPDEVRDRLVADIVDRVTDLAGDGTVSLPLVTNIAVGFREAES
jgi:SAM-dependent methyltransferase